MANQRKIPTRTCCSCGKSSAKGDLIRFVRSPEGIVSADATGRASGRGAYICADENCFEKAMRQHRLDKALKVSIGNSEYDSLKREFGAILADRAGFEETAG
ncbi:MAG: YlxR family protein [Coriobacteriales bacterium]|nr:YlxR family protein [Coriobacteriales bacterium]